MATAMSKELSEVSVCVQVRLGYFRELVADREYGKKRAIAGLRSWASSNAYRLTEVDKAEIKWAIAAYQ